MNLNDRQTIKLKTPEQFQRVNKIIASFRKNLSKPCAMLAKKREQNRTNHADGLTELRIRNHAIKERQLWSDSNLRYQKQMTNDIARTNNLRMA